jgi:iron complex transport system permease protein
MKTAARSDRRFSILVLLALLLILAFLTHLGMGGTWLTPADVLRVLFHPDPNSRDYAVVWAIRLPRALACVLVGSMLAAVGSAFQALFRNPLADPYIVGVSSGAGAGGALAWLLGLTGLWGGLGTMGLGFLGGLASLALVFALSKKRGIVDVSTLLLAGVVVGSLLWALTTLILFLAGQDTNKILQWLLGSMSPMFMDRVLVMAVTAAIGTTILILQARKLNAFAIGESIARNLGVDTARLKATVLITGTAMAAVCVGAVGIIGFLGLVSPHIARRLL